MNAMNYQVIARKFRPRTFKEMVGQEPLVTTLKNAIRLGRMPHAYIFSGPRGTGKTSVARLFAKAINCENRTEESEPCNTCSSCLEIQSGHSLDVLEIDGASNRGIDDIRKINETVGFSSLSGRYKIYLIDEVHMLTKEAFNALLKTLEEPPPKVKFLFATTEPHKVLPTILSRCQRFQLQRIPFAAIVQKLKWIASELGIDVEEEALRLIAKRAEGGLRDAESLFDQMISFQEGKVTAASAADLLGVPSKEHFFAIDRAVSQGDYTAMQQTADAIFQEGKDLVFFYDCLIDHFRMLLLTKLKAVPPLLLAEGEQKRYEESQTFYTKESLMATLDFLLEAQSRARTSPITQTSLEQVLYKILRLSQLESVGELVRKLTELERKIGGAPLASAPPPAAAKPIPAPVAPPKPAPTAAPVAPPVSTPLSAPVTPQPIAPVVQPPAPATSITVDPTPSAADFKGVRPAMKAPSAASPVAPAKPAAPAARSLPSSPKLDTLLHFAAIELEGKITKN